MPHTKEYDIPYAYDLFQRITRSATVDGQPLAAILLDGRHNLWHCVAQEAFIGDCKNFSVTKKFADVAQAYRDATRGDFSLKYFLVGGFAFLVTLISIVGLVGKKRALIYSVDRLSPRGRFDFRMERVYRELKSRNIRYVEVFHTVIGKRFLSNLFARGRTAIYLEGLEWAYYVGRGFKRLVRGRIAPVTIGGLKGFTDDERTLAEALLTKYMSIAPLLRYRADFLTRVLKGRVRFIFTIDDARHYHEVMIAGTRLDVTSYAFQHSHVTPYHVGWLKGNEYRGEYARPDYFLVWNKYWKSEMLELDSLWGADELIVAGSPKDTSVFQITRANSEVMPRVVVIPFETAAPHTVVREVILRLTECADVSVVIKLRLDLPKEEQLAYFGELSASVKTIVNLSELGAAHAVLGTYSTFLYDAAEAGLPVGLIKTPLKYTKRMVQNALASEVTVGQVCEAVERLVALSESDVRFRQGVLAEENHLSTVIGVIVG